MTPMLLEDDTRREGGVWLRAGGAARPPPAPLLKGPHEKATSPRQPASKTSETMALRPALESRDWGLEYTLGPTSSSRLRGTRGGGGGGADSTTGPQTLRTGDAAGPAGARRRGWLTLNGRHMFRLCGPRLVRGIFVCFDFTPF